MQVSVETTSELGRKLIVEIPEQRVQELITPRLNEIAREIRMDGFRPGKVPLQIIKRQFGLKVREDILSELFQSSLEQALEQNGIRPVTRMDVQSLSVDDGMRYEASFEILPQFVLMPFESMDVTRYLPEVSDQDVDEAVERLRQTQETWIREERPARSGDRVIVNFEGRVGEESVTEGRVENYPVVLGGAEKIPGFDEHLTGQSGNSHVEFDVRFPEDYPKANMADKVISFRVDVIRVESRHVPEANAEWIKSVGAEDGELESLRKLFRKELEREMKAITDDKTKTSVMDAVCAANPITLPEGLIVEELDSTLEALRKKAEQDNTAFDETRLRTVYRPLMARRVQLALVLGQAVDIYDIQLRDEQVEAKLAEVVSAYSNAEEVAHWYKTNKEAYQSVERMAHEEEVVRYILGKARVREVIMTPRDTAPTAAVA